MKWNFIFTCIFITIVFTTNAQEGTYVLGQNDMFYDLKLRELVNTHIKLNQDRNGLKGYRVQVFYESGQNARQNAQTLKTQFERRYSDCKAYVEYQSPYFKVLVGDFRTRNEALIFRKQILENYPNSWILETKINFPEL